MPELPHSSLPEACIDNHNQFWLALTDPATEGFVTHHNSRCATCKKAFQEFKDTSKALENAFSSIPSSRSFIESVVQRLDQPPPQEIREFSALRLLGGLIGLLVLVSLALSVSSVFEAPEGTLPKDLKEADAPRLKPVETSKPQPKVSKSKPKGIAPAKPQVIEKPAKVTNRALSALLDLEQRALMRPSRRIGRRFRGKVRRVLQRLRVQVPEQLVEAEIELQLNVPTEARAAEIRKQVLEVMSER